MLGIPTKRLQIRGQPTTPYHSCNVRITTGASYSLPKLFPDPIVPFTKLRLLGPLNDQQKYWHPIKEGNSFSQSAMINGKFPNVTPLHIDGTRITYNMRKENAYFWDTDGLEKALLKNMDMAYEEEQQLAKKAKEGKDAKTPAQ